MTSISFRLTQRLLNLEGRDFRVQSTMTMSLDIKKRLTEEQIIGFLREAEAGMPVTELCRKHAFSEAKHLIELESENTRLKKLLAEPILENEIAKEVLRKSGERIVMA